MKNTMFKLSPLIVACSMASAPVAAEDKLSVHGQLNVSADYSDITALPGKDNVLGRMEGTDLKSNASRFGFSGALDTTLGKTKLIYKADVQYSAVGNNGDGAGDAGNDDKLFLRDAFAGLKHKKYGKLQMGRFTVGYKSSYVKIDPWTDHTLQMRQSGQQGASNLNSNYFNYAVGYTSPKWKGFSINGHYSVLADDNLDSLHNSGKLKDMKGGSAGGVGLKFTNGGLRLTADMLNLDSKNDPGKTDPTKAKNGTAYSMTAQYKFSSGTTLAGMYENVKDVNLGENMFAIVSQKIGKYGLVTAGYGTNLASNDNAYTVKNDNDSSSISVGAKYFLTKKSALIAGYNNYERGKEKSSTFTVGIDAKFGY
jgi:predicted porin